MIAETTLPLFQTVASRTCDRCFDTGIWLTPKNRVEVCPRIQIGAPHSEPNPAAFIVRRAALRIAAMELWINPQTFDLARLLSNFSSGDPCPRSEIFETFYGDTNLSYPNQLRKFHSLVEEMRRVWLLPVGSRKDEPSGYWIITDLDDFKTWIGRVKAAPITQLSTIHKVARHNFPHFAEQMELEFWNDIQTESGL